MGKEKIDIYIVFIGRPRSGSSTTAGHLLYKVEGSDKGFIEWMEKRIEKQDSDMSLKYALMLDYLRPINSRAHFCKFETAKYNCKLLDDDDTDLIQAADCTVLIIDSTTGGFDGIPGKWMIRGDTITGDLLTRGVNQKQMICCCNKMDATLPKYSEARYDEIVKEVTSYLKEVGYNTDEIPFVPISGFEGDNLIERSTNLDWYKGPTLLEALDQINEPNRPASNSKDDPAKGAANFTSPAKPKEYQYDAWYSPPWSPSFLHNSPKVSSESAAPESPEPIYEEEPSPKLGGWLTYHGSPTLSDGKSTGLGKLYWDSPDLKLKESPMPSEEEAPAEGEESPEYAKKLAEETHKDAEKAAFDEAEKKREKEGSKDAPAESDAEEEAEDDDNEADDSKVI